MAATTRKTPTTIIRELGDEKAAAEVKAAVNNTKFWFSAGVGGLVALVALMIYFVAPPRTIVTHNGVTTAEVEAFIGKATDAAFAKLPTPQPGLTHEQLQGALKGVNSTLATINGRLDKFSEIDGKIADVLVKMTSDQAKHSAVFQDGLKKLGDGQDIIKTMLEGLPAKLAPQKGSEQKQEPAPVAAKQPPAPADASGNPVQPAASQQPAAERQEFSAKDVAKACTDLNVKFQKPFEQMSQADLKAAFEQCEAAEKAATSKRWRRANKQDCPDRFDESAGACRKATN